MSTPRAGAIAVTGASRGIGAAVAIELAKRGYTVGCLTRKGQGVEQPAPPADLSDRLIPVQCDVTDEASLRTAFAALVARAGSLAGVVNNAGIHVEARSHEMPTETWTEVMDTNARSVFVACREAYPHLATAGGTIVNIGSFFDKLGVKRNLAYCASKAAVGAITRCLAVEWASKRIRVLDVAPGYIKTDLNVQAMEGPLKDFLAKRVPTGGPGGPQDVARLVAALFAENIPFLTGETLYVDGGQGMAH
jgi:NAD(P)-dependent dehydrogenase (short-subunit alcohol dehydrogenase family)